MRDTESTVPTQGTETVVTPRRPREEVIRLGKEMYERDIRRKVEDAHDGEVISIDVESGDWAVADSVIAATDSLWARHPGAVDIYSLRIGYGLLRHFGGRPRRRVG